MDSKKLFIIALLIALLPFVTYLSTQHFLDGDSYYYLSGVCNGTSTNLSDLLFSFVVMFLPCNVFLIKIYLLIVYLLFLLIMTALIAWETNTKYYYLTPLLITMSLCISEFMKFENDGLGLVFGVLGLYLLSKKHYLKALISFGVGAGLWFGVLYWGLTFFFSFPIFILLIFPIGTIVIEKMFWFIGKHPRIIELTSWIGFINYLFLLPLFYLSIFYKHKKRNLILFLFFILINIWVAKLWVLAIPFGLILIFDFLEQTTNKELKRQVINYIWVAGIIMSLFFVVSIPTQPITENDLELIKEGVDLACLENNCLVENDFSVGWVVKHYGGETKQYASTKPYEYSGIVIDIKKLPTPSNCIEIQQSNHFLLLKCNQKTM